jgi:hypothetical protein
MLVGSLLAMLMSTVAVYVPSRLPAIWSRCTYLGLEILVLLVPNHLLLHKFLDRFRR